MTRDSLNDDRGRRCSTLIPLQTYNPPHFFSSINGNYVTLRRPSDASRLEMFSSVTNLGYYDSFPLASLVFLPSAVCLAPSTKQTRGR